MTKHESDRSAVVSRRRVLRDGALVAGGAAFAVGVFAAAPAFAGKTSQKGVSYQATPKGAARCDNCKFWQPPAACKVVDGIISPSGWCTLYAKKH